MELMKRWRDLNNEFPGLAGAMALVSCEEAVSDVRGYVARGDTPAADGVEKEHVMVCVNVILDGRAALLLADPGYHVARVVTVMADKAYPHTGWFTQSDTPENCKEYNYVVSPHNNGYVEWQERRTRDGNVRLKTSLVYVARPYRNGVHVTERRNLVYNFKSLMSRDQKGQPVAGLYFPVSSDRDALFTLFFDSGNENRKTKYRFNMFLDPNSIPYQIIEDIEMCNEQLNYDYGELRTLICKLAKVMDDQPFIEQLLAINEDIRHSL